MKIEITPEDLCKIDHCIMTAICDEETDSIHAEEFRQLRDRFNTAWTKAIFAEWDKER